LELGGHTVAANQREVVEVGFTPKDMPVRRPVRVASALVYSTRTGDKLVRPERVEIENVWDQPFCFVCSRCTDHFAEHDDMIEAGTAEYGADGSVYKL
jgi:hypothetical protein